PAGGGSARRPRAGRLAGDGDGRRTGRRDALGRGAGRTIRRGAHGRGPRRRRARPGGEAGEGGRLMDAVVIRGGRALEGEVTASGSKNAALPLIFSTLLTRERCVIRNVPMLADVATALQVLRHLGARAQRSPDGREVIVEARDIACSEAPYELVKTMRASFLVLGPLLARFGLARVSTPGGCALRARPVDFHLVGLERLGVQLRINEGYVEAQAERLRGAKILLDFPSVGATQQLLMAGALAEGTTVIENAAREPETVCLALA